MHSGKFTLHHLWLNKIIQVSDNIAISLKLIFVFNNVFSLLIITISFKIVYNPFNFGCVNRIVLPILQLKNSARAVWDRPNPELGILSGNSVAQSFSHKSWDRETTSIDAIRKAFMFQEVYYFIHKIVNALSKYYYMGIFYFPGWFPPPLFEAI